MEIIKKPTGRRDVLRGMVGGLAAAFAAPAIARDRDYDPQRIQGAYLSYDISEGGNFEQNRANPRNRSVTAYDRNGIAFVIYGDGSVQVPAANKVFAPFSPEADDFVGYAMSDMYTGLGIKSANNEFDTFIEQAYRDIGSDVVFTLLNRNRSPLKTSSRLGRQVLNSVAGSLLTQIDIRRSLDTLRQRDQINDSVNALRRFVDILNARAEAGVILEQHADDRAAKVSEQCRSIEERERKTGIPLTRAKQRLGC